MATLLKANGTEQPIADRLTLPVMQKLVGGFVEFVTIGGTPDARELLIVNETGLLDGLPPNVAATVLYRGTPPRHDGVIVGDAIRCVCTHMGHDNETYA
jgi:Domain of unknown function (DUF3846)